MKCKYYRRKDTEAQRYVVYMPWHGRTLTRTAWDAVQSIETEGQAIRLCHVINADYQKDPEAFDPFKFFQVSLSELLFSNFGPSWLAEKEIEDSSHELYAQVINDATELLGDLSIKEIRKVHIKRYVETLRRKELSNNTIQHRLSILKILFRDAFNDEIIDRVPGWPKIKTTKPKTRGLSALEQEEVLAYIPSHDRPIYRFMVYYGVRVGEAVALQWDCVLWQRRIILIKRTVSGKKIRESRKAGDELELPMTDEMYSLLRPLRSFTGFVFLNSRGNRYDRRNLLRTCYVACEKAGVPRVSLHELCRHSKGRQLAARGEPIDVIAALLGHRNTQTTKRYAPLTGEGLRRLVE